MHYLRWLGPLWGWGKISYYCVMAALSLHLLLPQLGERYPFAIFIGAVIVAAWLGGWRQALLTTGLAVVSLLSVAAFFQSPQFSSDFAIRLVLFVVVGLLAGFLSHQCRLAVHAFDRVHATLANLGEALVFVNADNQITYLNPLAQTLTGWSPADARLQPLEKVLRLVHAETGAAVALKGSRGWSGIGTATAEAPAADPLPDDALLLTSGGSALPVEGKIGPLSDGLGRVVGATITFRDTSARRRTEEEIRRTGRAAQQMADHAPAGLFTLDDDGRCTFANNACQALCGCNGEECLGEGWSRNWFAKDRDKTLSDLLATVQQEEAFTGEFRIKNPRGDLRWVRMRTVPMPAENGDETIYCGLLEDVSDHKDHEARIAEFAAQQQRAEESLRIVHQEYDRKLTDAATRQQQLEEAVRLGRGALDKQTHEFNARQQKSEEAWKKSTQELERKLQEAVAAQRGAEEVLQKTQAELKKSAEELAAGQLLIDEAVQRARQEFERQGEAERFAALKQAEEVSRQALAELRQQMEAERMDQARIVAELEEQLALTQLSEGEWKRQHDALHAQTAQMASREGEYQSLRLAHETLQAEHYQLRSAHEALHQDRASLAAAHETVQREHAELHAAHEVHQATAQDLRTQNELLTSILSSAPYGIVAFDRDRRLTFWNAAMTRLSGRSLANPPGFAAGQRMADLFPTLVQTGEDDHVSQALSGTLTHSQSALLFGEATAAPGWLETCFAPLRNHADEVSGGLVIVRERTDRPRTTPGPHLLDRNDHYALWRHDVEHDWLSYN